MQPFWIWRTSCSMRQFRKQVLDGTRQTRFTIPFGAKAARGDGLEEVGQIGKRKLVGPNALFGPREQDPSPPSRYRRRARWRFCLHLKTIGDGSDRQAGCRPGPWEKYTARGTLPAPF